MGISRSRYETTEKQRAVFAFQRIDNVLHAVYARRRPKILQTPAGNLDETLLGFS